MKQHYLYYVFLPALFLLGFLGFTNLWTAQRPAVDVTQPAENTNPAPRPENPTQQSPSKSPSKNTPTAQTSQAAPSQLHQKTAREIAGSTKRPTHIVAEDGQTYPLLAYKPLVAPNDPSANQWWVAPNGMQQVWDMPFGSRATKIAIIDTGFALNHQEFSGRWATNTGESGPATVQGTSLYNCSDQGLALNMSCNVIDDDFDGIVDNESGPTTVQNRSFLNCSDQGIPINKACNRLDDDSNGLIDDYHGFDFANYDSSPQAGETNPDGTGTTHGTMVAGVLGANGNNSVGIAGVNWYSTILPIQALDDDSYGDSYTVSEAIRYAADQGSDVISISLGTASQDPYLRMAVQYAMSKGAIVVAASGNDGCECISYPANYPEVVAVGAINSSGNPTTFSNYGRNLDLLAPGQSIATSTWNKNNPSATYVNSVAGTSFSTPFVSGLLGLARSYQPDASWEEIMGAMLENSDRRTLTSASPRSTTLGFGVARANTMLDRLRAPATPALRYQFSPSFIGSARMYQCENTLPASQIYELSKPGQLRYTASTYQQYLATQQGWISRELMYGCVGLPTDTPSTIRTIDLTREINNLTLKQ